MVKMWVISTLKARGLELLWFQEKGGREHRMPAHDTAIEYSEAYLEAHWRRREGPLFARSTGQKNGYTERRLDRREALVMVKRRCKPAGGRASAQDVGTMDQLHLAQPKHSVTSPQRIRFTRCMASSSRSPARQTARAAGYSRLWISNRTAL